MQTAPVLANTLADAHSLGQDDARHGRSLDSLLLKDIHLQSEKAGYPQKNVGNAMLEGPDIRKNHKQFNLRSAIKLIGRTSRLLFTTQPNLNYTVFLCRIRFVQVLPHSTVVGAAKYQVKLVLCGATARQQARGKCNGGVITCTLGTTVQTCCIYAETLTTRSVRNFRVQGLSNIQAPAKFKRLTACFCSRPTSHSDMSAMAAIFAEAFFSPVVASASDSFNDPCSPKILSSCN